MARLSVEKLGSAGAITVAAACPICFPKLALVGAALGFGAFAPLEGYLVFVVQALALLALGGHVHAFRTHRNRWLLGLAGFATLLLFAGFFVVPSPIVMQAALLGLAGASVWLLFEYRRCARCAESSGLSTKEVAR